jgi:hypothetical protein
MIFVGDDWAEDHHDVELMNQAGATLARRRVPEGVEGVRALHALIAEHADEPGEVAVGIETDQGMWVSSLVAAGYQVYAVNPKVAARYRDRHSIAGAKSDPSDARMLADLVRTDRHRFRTIAGDSVEADALKVLARAHQRLIWARQRHLNGLRATLRDFYPAALVAFGSDLAHPDALGVLASAPTPEQGRRMSVASITAALKRGGRKRYFETRAREIHAALRSEQLAAPAGLADAYGASVAASVAVIAEMTRQIAALEAQLVANFDAHPDAEIIRSLPGLGDILGARVLGEFGDDPTRYQNAKSRKNYAGTAPITRASGTKRAVLARFVRNRHLADACYLWAFCALTASPGAKAYYDAHKRRGDSHDQALRALGNRLVGILDGCLRHRCTYDETTAWGHRSELDRPTASAA